MLEFYPSPHHHHQPGLMHQSQDTITDHPTHLLPHLHHSHLHHYSHLDHSPHQQHPHHQHQPRREDQTSLKDASAQPDSQSPLIAANPALMASCDNSVNGRTVVGTIKCEKNYELCEGCGQKIHDRYLMRVGESSWHEHCLACGMCGVPLNNSCYVRNCKLYCKADYDRLFSIKCSRCGDRVQPNDMVMRAQNFVFHLPCFVCCVCCQPLQKGEQFVLRSGQLFCRHDFEKDMLYMSQHGSGATDDDLLLDDCRPRDGRRGPKRPRTILTSAQRRQFKASFELSPKPCRKVREALAKDTGLSVRVVQVWFQNQRAKMKKIQRKSKQDNGADKNGDKEGKEEKRIKQESPSSEHGLYLGMDSSFGSSQPLNPNMPFSPDDYPANSNDSFCSSDISMDGSNFDQLDEATSDTISLQNMDMHGGSSNHHHHQQHGQHHHQHHHHQASSDSGIMCGGGGLSSSSSSGLGAGGNVNPIDKLYLMQNSYFSSE